MGKKTAELLEQFEIRTRGHPSCRGTNIRACITCLIFDFLSPTRSRLLLHVISCSFHQRSLVLSDQRNGLQSTPRLIVGPFIHTLRSLPGYKSSVPLHNYDKASTVMSPSCRTMLPRPVVSRLKRICRCETARPRCVGPRNQNLQTLCSKRVECRFLVLALFSGVDTKPT